MEINKQKLIDAFFNSFFKKDRAGIEMVMDEKVTWSFLGKHKLAGIKYGIDEVVSFFDKMGSIMNDSKPTVDKLIVASNEDFLIECQHIKTNRNDGINIDHEVSVLWKFENGKIISGTHFFSDPNAVDLYFNSVPVNTITLVGFFPLIVKQNYQASLDKVWKALTDENIMRKWYFESMKSFKPETGFETQFKVNFSGKEYLHIWKVTEVIPEIKISYTWKYDGIPGESIVTFELSKENDQSTLLKFSENGIESFPQNNNDLTRESRLNGWHFFICKRLKDFLDKG